VNLLSDRLSYLASRVAFDITRPRAVEFLVLWHFMENCDLLVKVEIHFSVYKSQEFALNAVLAAEWSYC
jgi:hypothetical protein